MSWLDLKQIGKWQNHGGILRSAPTATSWGLLRTDIFVRGADNKVWQDCRDENNASKWMPAPFENPDDAIIDSAPSVVTWGVNKLCVVAANINGGVFCKLWDVEVLKDKWSKWIDLKHPVASKLFAPFAVSEKKGYMDVFALGHDSNLWHKKFCTNIFDPYNTNWENLGRPGEMVGFASGPAAAYVNGHLVVFIIGSDGVLYRKSWEGGQATKFIADGYNRKFKSTPAVISLFNRNLWVLCIDKETDEMYQRTFNPNPVDGWTKFKIPMTNGNKPKGIGGCTFKYNEGTIASVFARGTDDQLWEIMLPLSLGV
jgi:hypothetical protein